MECSICSYKTDKKWLYKRHQETNKKCRQVKSDQESYIKYTGYIELYKLQNNKLKNQIRKLKIENYRLKKDENNCGHFVSDFIVFNKSDLTATELQQINDVIINVNSLFEQTVEYILNLMYYSKKNLKAPEKISYDECLILDDGDWVSVSFASIVDDLWNFLINPLFEKVKKEWCSYNYHIRFKKIVFDTLCYSHIEHPS